MAVPAFRTLKKHVTGQVKALNDTTALTINELCMKNTPIPINFQKRSLLDCSVPTNKS
jgi:hypothetical protein